MIFYSYAYGEVYYCSENTNVGFRIKDNNNKMSFRPKRFKIKVDLQKPMIESKEILMQSFNAPICRYDSLFKTTIYCSSNIGLNIALDTTSNVFILARIFLIPNQNDTNNISWGTCEIF